MDDIIDFCYGAADRVLLYKINQIPFSALEVAKLIQRQAEELLQAVCSLNSREKAFKRCMAIKQLEYDADRIASSSIAELFDSETDAIQLIKVKELYSLLASASHRAKGAANAIETIMMKRGPG